MGMQPILPIEVSVTIDTMFNFDSDSDGDGDSNVTWKQTFDADTIRYGCLCKWP